MLLTTETTATPSEVYAAPAQATISPACRACGRCAKVRAALEAEGARVPAEEPARRGGQLKVLKRAAA